MSGKRPTPTAADIAVQQRLPELADRLDHALERIAGRRMGFVLIPFSLNESQHYAGYISNCSRDQVTALLRELIEHLERAEPLPPAHHIN